MRYIKYIARAMENSIREADEHIRTAYDLREAHMDSAAEWYRDMARDHIRSIDGGHNVVEELINQRKLKNDSEYNRAMADVWADLHKDIVCEAAKVQALIDHF